MVIINEHEETIDGITFIFTEFDNGEVVIVEKEN